MTKLKKDLIREINSFKNTLEYMELEVSKGKGTYSADFIIDYIITNFFVGNY
ncbi:hypothetical protein LCGC14_1544590 [marine sediment metagenome]|uniref:Uncharacterized protein n=1 Tax=marine sediment metagenome TaxID=412755 RepID=A0A0F9JD11_9ZZZZ